MTPGEPLETIKDAESDPVEPVALDAAPCDTPRDRDAMLSDTADLLSQTLEGIRQDEVRMEPEDEASLDAEVRTLLHAIAEEESEHDEAWVEESRREDEDADDTFAAMERDALAQAVAPVPDEDDGRGDTGREDAGHGDDGRDGIAQEAPTPPEAMEADDSPDAAGVVVAEAPAGETVPEAATAPEEASPDAGGFQAIGALSDRFEAAEARNDEALGRIGHALGMIATRIDGLESRATDRTIADVAFVAAPPDDDDEDDASVAPYIARAEKELKAKKESGSMDIFDRIARAAETEFDGQAANMEGRVVANASDGRRVGTKKWQPSKAVKKRMEQLEQARVESEAGAAQTVERPAPASRRLRVETEEAPVAETAQIDDAAPLTALDPEPAFDEHDQDDDAGLSVLPGARGRRRNRARKSSLDTDFENVFAEEGDKPSIQSLRRKMRERPVEAPEAEEPSKGGMLGGILGKKSAKKAAPEPEIDDFDGHGEDDDLMAAFDASGDAPALDAAPRTAKSGKKAKQIDIDDEDDDDDGWDDGDAASGSRRKPLLYALIVVAAGAGFAVWKMFLA